MIQEDSFIKEKVDTRDEQRDGARDISFYIQGNKTLLDPFYL